jgi:hypothetical protein
MYPSCSRPTPRVPAAWLLVCFIAGFAGTLAGAILVPYSADSTTLHLWHFDGSGTTTTDEVQTAGITLTNFPQNTSSGTTISLGNAPFSSAFNACLHITATNFNAGNAYAFASNRLGSVTGTTSFRHPTTAAFTFEALVKMDGNPTNNGNQEIICGDNSTSGTGVGGTRAWQFRINASGTGAATNLARLEFNSISTVSGSMGDFFAILPANGVNAWTTGQWFHAAVTYTGTNGASPGVLSFYWTLAATNAASANLLTNFTGLTGVLGGNPTLGIGGSARANNGVANAEGFKGSIDEVRISSVARGAGEFLFIATDADGDGLPDAWEITYFTNITAYGAADDPDNDGYTNLQEYQAGSNPTNILSTPLDTDADGLPDAWETTYFSTLAYGPSDDPDNDGYTNLQEYQAGTNPNNAASNPGDTDADGLPDAWELQYFGTLAYGATDDTDGDGYTNLQEYQAGTLPNNANSHPALPVTTYIPIDDGNTNTSEYGYAGDPTGNDQINGVAFIRSGLITVSNQQFIIYYYRHATSSGDTNNNRIVVARRNLDTNLWAVFHTTFAANDINDGHDVACAGIDGNGYLHLSWGMHGNSFLYAKTTGPVTGTNSIAFGSPTTMTGGENNVTYPQFLTLPNGDLLFIFREGSSGAGDTFINRYNRATQTWTNQQYGAGQQPFIKGTWTTSYNCYPNMPCLDAAGNLFFIWVWRQTPAYQSNHDFSYAKSTNGGRTWLRSNGTPYALPISANGENGDTNTMAERILDLPQNYSTINQAGMCLEINNKPVVASWWSPGTPTNNYRRQYMVLFNDTNGAWQTRQVSFRTIDSPATFPTDSMVRDLGRPVVVCDKQDRIIVLYRDDQGSNGLTIANSLPGAADPNRLLWTTFDLTTDNLGCYEPVIDNERWARDNVLDILYQASIGQGYTAPANNAAPIGVLEWNAAAWFAHQPAIQLDYVNSGHDAAVSFSSQTGWSYRLWATTNLFGTWQAIGTVSGNNSLMQIVHTNGGVGPQHYWRLEIKEGGF